MAAQKRTCVCGTSFPTREHYKSHESCCDYAKVVDWERTLKFITSPGSECYICGRLLSLDDVLYRDKTLVFCPYDGAISCSSCREADIKDELLMPRNDVDEYLKLRRSTAPQPWLKLRREDLFRKLQEYLFHPVRVHEWLESGHDLESYMN